jgi:hypothetical protein
MIVSLLKLYKFKSLALFRYLKIAGYTDRLLNVLYPKRIQTNLSQFRMDQVIPNQSQVKFFSGKLQIERYLLYTPQFVVRSSVEMEADFYFAYLKSVEELGKNIELIINLNKSILNGVLKKTLLIIDGHTLLNLPKSQVEILNLFRLSGGVVLFDHPDLIKSKNGEKLLDQCFRFADFGVIHNPRLSFEKFSNRVILWPTYPFADVFSSAGLQEKKSALLFSGSLFRGLNGRKYFFKYAVRRGLDVIDSMADSEKKENIFSEYSEYLKSLEVCKLSFTTGYRNRRESLLAFRCIELMLRGVVVLYEEGSFIDYFFIPYVHYIPVKNAPDMFLKAKYLLRNPELINSVSTNAKLYCQAKFSNKTFWAEIDKMLNISRNDIDIY